MICGSPAQEGYNEDRMTSEANAYRKIPDKLKRGIHPFQLFALDMCNMMQVALSGCFESPSAGVVIGMVIVKNVGGPRNEHSNT